MALTVSFQKPTLPRLAFWGRTKRQPVKARWVLDLEETSQLRTINIADTDKYPDGIPPRVVLKKTGHGPGPKYLAVRRKGIDGQAGFDFADLYDGPINANSDTDTPEGLYNYVTQPEMSRLIKTKMGLWSKLQTGLYITALVIVAAVVALVIVVMMGE